MQIITPAIRFFVAFILLCINLTHAALPIEELQTSISVKDPIYNVRAGELEMVLDDVKKYNMIVLVTTSEPRYQCEMCGQFDPIFKKIVTNIYTTYPDLMKNTFFIRVEASNNLEQLKKLGIKSVPQIWGFPDSRIAIGEEKFVKVERELMKYKAAISEGTEYIKPDWYDIDQAGMEHYIMEMAKGDSWDVVIQKLTGFISNTIRFDVNNGVLARTNDKKAEFDWVVSVQWFIYVFIGIKVFQKIKATSSTSTPLWVDKRFYAYISIVLILVNISGFNFTIQRHSPFISQRDGKILWIAPQSNLQFGSEIAISILLQIFYIVALYVLASSNSFKIDQNIRDVMISISCLVLIGLLIVGSAIYNVKSPSYPFNYLW